MKPEFTTDDSTASRMWEISENLHRAELSALERDKLVAEWCSLVGKPIQSELVSKGGRGNKSGESEAARQLGLSQPDVHRAVKVASLTPEAQAKAHEVGLADNRTALLEAAKSLTKGNTTMGINPDVCDKKCQGCRIGEICEGSPYSVFLWNYTPLTEEEATERYPHLPPYVVVALTTLRDRAAFWSGELEKEPEYGVVGKELYAHSAMADGVLKVVSDALSPLVGGGESTPVQQFVNNVDAQ